MGGRGSGLRSASVSGAASSENLRFDNVDTAYAVPLDAAAEYVRGMPAVAAADLKADELYTIVYPHRAGPATDPNYSTVYRNARLDYYTATGAPTFTQSNGKHVAGDGYLGTWAPGTKFYKQSGRR